MVIFSPCVSLSLHGILFVWISVDWKKKKHSLKVENFILLGWQSEDWSSEDSVSDSSEGCSQEVREEPG